MAVGVRCAQQGLRFLESWGQVKKVELPPEVKSLGVSLQQWNIDTLWGLQQGAQELTEGEVRLIVRCDGTLFSQLQELRGSEGFFDVLSLTSDFPNEVKGCLRSRDCHSHDVDEVRLVLAGNGVFTFWNPDAAYTVAVGKGSFIHIPAQCQHAFKLTETKCITMLRVFSTPKYPKTLCVDAEQGSS